MRNFFFGLAFSMLLVVTIIAFQNLFEDTTYIMMFFTAFYGSVSFPIMFIFLIGFVAGGSIVLGVRSKSGDEDEEEEDF